MDKIDCCLRYEVAPLTQMVELRTLLPTSKLYSRHYEMTIHCVPRSVKEEQNTLILYVMTNDM